MFQSYQATNEGNGSVRLAKWSPYRAKRAKRSAVMASLESATMFAISGGDGSGSCAVMEPVNIRGAQ